MTSDVRQVCEEKAKDIRAILGDIVTDTNGKVQIGIDTPKYFNFQKFVDYDFQKPNKYQNETGIPWKSYYHEQFNEIPVQHNLTILDFSQLASDVLENITALIGRIIL